ncbi:MAG: hypothetical protein JG769_1387 [Oscillospiraceae bacterium]|jgi:diguanylate cyclase (GGDEF)-like protein/PAS domain S-box-containing protein|nr:hypothetical protein [Oscillospiraceae bacterium]
MRGGRDDGMGKLIYRMETAVDATGFKGIYDRLIEAYAELEALTNSIPGGVAKVDIDIKNGEIIIRYASDGFFELTGYSRNEYIELINRGEQLIFFDDIVKLFKNIKKNLKEKKTAHMEYRIRKKDGSEAWIMVQGRAIEEKESRYTVMCIFTDITEMKETQRRLEIEEERYRIVSDISNEYLFEYINETDTMVYSEKYCRHFGLEEKIVPEYKKSVEKREIILKEDWPIFLDIYENMRKGNLRYSNKYRVKELDGEIKWYSICFTTIFDKNNVPLKSVGKIVNIDDQMKETVKLKEKAQRDSLTKLSNARTTRKMIEQYIKEDYDACHAFIMVDIDNFKSINDCCGHLAGDNVLVQFAEELRKVFRSTDVLGRIGGDEFLVFLRGIQSDFLAEEKASAICGILNSIRLPGKESVKVSGSVGISTYPADGRDYETLLKKADEALYEAKRKGKNRYCKFYDGF